MAKDNLLKELQDDEITLLLDELKSDWPINVHAFSFVSTIQRWKAAKSDYKIAVFALNGDVKSKFIVYYSASPDLSDVRGSVHKWTHRGDDEEFFVEVLRYSIGIIPWDTRIYSVTAMTQETSRVVQPFLRELWKDQDWLDERGYHVYWVPNEEPREWTVEVPNGTYIAHLTETHARDIDQLWPHRYPGSERLAVEVIRQNFGIGLFDSSTHELLSMGLHTYYGGIGALQTPPHHMRKGYGRVVVKALTKEIAERGFDVHLIIRSHNTPSISLVKKCGYRLAFLCDWPQKEIKIV